MDILYSTLENIKNCRLALIFYGRFKSLHLIVFPNILVILSDRFNLFAIIDEINNYVIIKCKVNLKIDYN